MKLANTLTTIFIILSLCFIIKGCYTKQNIQPIKEIIYVPTTDTISIEELILLKEGLRKVKDSLEIYKSDTLMSADLFIAKYKLERIRYYNEIAKNGNNIKYLRGWINRVLNE